MGEGDKLVLGLGEIPGFPPNVEGIYLAYSREKNIQLGRLIGMRFDGAATFSADKTGVQRRLKELSPHALSLSCPSTGFSASC